MTGGISEKTINAVHSIKEGAGEARNSLEEIVKSIHTVNDHFVNISAATEEISASSGEVASASENVSDLADQLVKIANELNETADKLG